MGPGYGLRPVRDDTGEGREKTPSKSLAFRPFVCSRYVLMSSPQPIPPDADDLHSLMLRRLASLSLELAESLQQRAMEAETTEEAARAAEAFHKVARGLRQTLALEL